MTGIDPRMKKYLAILFSLLFIFGCERYKGFTIKKITSYYEPSDQWEAAHTLSDEILLKILDQPYMYLGSGNHTYAFESFLLVTKLIVPLGTIHITYISRSLPKRAS